MALFLFATAGLTARAAPVIVVSNINTNTIGEYDTLGAPLNPSLITGLSSPQDIAASGANLFVVNFQGGTVGEYTTSGTVVNAALIAGLHGPAGIALSGSKLYVTNSANGTIGEYNLDGSVINAALVTGLNTPAGIAVSGSRLFVSNEFNVTPGAGTIGEYDANTGAPVNASLITGLNIPDHIAVSQTALYVSNNHSGSETDNGASGSIGEYNLDGSVINAALVSGLKSPEGITIFGGVLFVALDNGGTNGLVEEFDSASGAAISAPLISGLNGAQAIAVAGVAGSPPTVVTQPASQSVANGSTVVFTASIDVSLGTASSSLLNHSASVATRSSASAAQGANFAIYQWFLNGAGISGATGSTYVIVGATPADDGNYTCLVTNSAGSVLTKPAALSVVATNDPGRLVNISTRANVGTGGNILIAGFVSGGAATTGSQQLLVRASGPALVPFGVQGTLPDPQLQLYSGSAAIATNNGWAGNAQVAATAASVEAFAWGSSSSHDSALVQTPPRGPYTAQVSGQSGDAGVALVEVYDATPSGTYTPSLPRLVNISARVQVGTGGNILIAGFVVGGSTSRTVLIRASGPALVPFEVQGTLPDPQLQLFRGSVVVASNSGWGGNAQIASTAASVGAFAWNNAASSDSALLVTLPPGAYTAQVAGASGDTGVSLVEVYEVP